MERCVVNKDLYLCFINYSKAFHKVHVKLFNLLSTLDIDGKDLRIHYWEQEEAIVSKVMAWLCVTGIIQWDLIGSEFARVCTPAPIV